MKKLHLSAPREVFKCKIFKVQEQTCTSQGGASSNVYTFAIADWVQVIPVTKEGNIVLVSQHRFGTDTIMLETPGGAIDAHEQDATLAAIRELEEETGYTSTQIIGLPSFHPNPALHGNRIYYFLAFNAEKAENPQRSTDLLEECEVVEMPFAQAVDMARTSQISHALSALGILLAEKYVSQKLKKV